MDYRDKCSIKMATALMENRDKCNIEVATAMGGV
jgi:hypothetical protein